MASYARLAAKRLCLAQPSAFAANPALRAFAVRPFSNTRISKAHQPYQPTTLTETTSAAVEDHKCALSTAISCGELGHKGGRVDRGLIASAL